MAHPLTLIFSRGKDPASLLKAAAMDGCLAPLLGGNFSQMGLKYVHCDPLVFLWSNCGSLLDDRWVLGSWFFLEAGIYTVAMVFHVLMIGMRFM